MTSETPKSEFQVVKLKKSQQPRVLNSIWQPAFINIALHGALCCLLATLVIFGVIPIVTLTVWCAAYLYIPCYCRSAACCYRPVLANNATENKRPLRFSDLQMKCCQLECDVIDSFEF